VSVAVLREAFADGLRPAPMLDLAEWSETNMVLSAESSASRGKFTAWPFQIEPMSVMSPRHPSEKVAMLCAAQVMKTQLLLNLVGFAIDVDPGPILFVEPRQADVEFVSKSKVAPMLRDVPCLRGKVADVKSRDSGNTINHKSFRGGSIEFATGNSPASLRMRSVRYLLLDEISSEEYEAGKDGDPVSNAEERASFWNRKIVYASTPRNEGSCRITDVFLHSDQRQWFVPCPHCGHEQILEWAGMVWSTNDIPIYWHENGQQKSGVVDPQRPMYRCAECDNLIAERDTRDVGRYIPQNPEGKYPGFRVNQLVCPTKKWGDLVQTWLQAQGKPEQIKSFINNKLAQTWKEVGEAPDWERLLSRREVYPPNRVPMGGLFLTAGVDVQADRIECSLYAWGRDRQRWLVEHAVLMGRTTEDKVWADLTAWKHRTWKHEGGADMSIVRLAIDTGHETNRVYQWVRTQGSETLAVDGRSSLFGSIVGQPTSVDVDISGRKVRRGVKLWPVDVSKLKHELYGSLGLARPEGGDYPAGWVHLSESVADPEFLKQLTAEQTVSRVAKGYRKVEWQKIRPRNEALDCAIYARAAANQAGWDRMTERQILSIESSLSVKAARAAEAAPAVQAQEQEAPMPAPPPVVRQQPERRQKFIRSSWVNR